MKTISWLRMLMGLKVLWKRRIILATAKGSKTSTLIPRGKTRAEKQKFLLQSGNSEIREHIQRINELIIKIEQDTIRDRYELGKSVTAIFDYFSQNGQGIYGKRVVEQLCEVFGWDRGILYSALSIARAFTDEEIISISERQMANGRPIPLGHFNTLAKIENRQIRQSLIDQMTAGAWTHDELKLAIIKASPALPTEAAEGGTKNDGRGRPPKAPKNLAGLLQQLEQAIVQFVNRSEVWEKPEVSITDQVQKLPYEEITDRLIGKLVAIADSMRVVAQKATWHAGLAQRASEYLKDLSVTSDGAKATPTPPRSRQTEVAESSKAVVIEKNESGTNGEESLAENHFGVQPTSERQPGVEVSSGYGAGITNKEDKVDEQPDNGGTNSEPVEDVDAEYIDEPQNISFPPGETFIKIHDPNQADANSPFRQILVYMDRWVVTFKMIDWWHETAHAASKSFYANTSQFREGVHYMCVPHSVWKKWHEDCDYRRPLYSPGYFDDRIVLTDREYLLLIKSFTDERSWEMHESVVRAYMFVKITAETELKNFLHYTQAVQLARESREELDYVTRKMTAS